MTSYKCACCAKPLHDFDDEWDGCTRCGCGTAEKVRMAPDDYKPMPDRPVPMEDQDE